ncbi:MBL fold metallo-hydrolase [Nonomuraea sp. LPB2021202275-12-8]|uniref:MBL fold metallo-hydrolase n=1 Tax=Nonomuraea sp. LPB2021202275-12-8 TaxID=3120159 RepID=UPI00300C32CB
MLIAGFPAGAFQTNCYVVAPAAGEECVIVDPGQDAVEGVEELLREHRLKPVAVMLTHGHLDHVWSVAPVCGARDVPAWIHPEDRHLLSDPAAGLSPGSASMFGGLTFTEPDDVRELSDGATLELAGLELVVDHTPGHTRGSVSFRLPADDVMFAGDLLFAGSIGRTDLPGGDYPTILRSLAAKCLPLPDDTVVLPGHGPQTTIGRERATNPYLKEAAPHAGPTRGI